MSTRGIALILYCSKFDVDWPKLSLPATLPRGKFWGSGTAFTVGLLLRNTRKMASARRTKTAKPPTERPSIMKGFLYQLKLGCVVEISVGFLSVELFVAATKRNEKNDHPGVNAIDTIA